MALDYLTHLRADATRFADVLGPVSSAARVPPCPDWNADDLLWHLSEVFLFWGAIVRDRLVDPEAAEALQPERPADHARLLDLYYAASGDLVATLDATPDGVEVWTWSNDHTAGFVRRRMAHEAVIHRLDAELVTGEVTPIDTALAADGVLEALQHFYGGHPDWSDYRPLGPTGHLRTTDTGDEWTFEIGGFSGLSPNTGKTYADEPCLTLVQSGEPSFTVSGSARDLDAWLWNRPPLDAVAVGGADADFQVFAAMIAKGID